MQNQYFSIKTMTTGIRHLLQIDLKEVSLVEYQIEMINQNARETLIAIENPIDNTNIQLKYDITGLCSLNEYLSKNTINKKLLLGVLDDICSILSEWDNYFLNQNNYLVNLPYIFMDQKTNKVKMIYLPIENIEDVDINQNFKSLLKEIIIDYAILEDMALDNYLHTILNTTKEVDFSIEKFRLKIKEMLKESENDFRKYDDSQDNSIKRNRDEKPANNVISESKIINKNIETNKDSYNNDENLYSNVANNIQNNSSKESNMHDSVENVNKLVYKTSTKISVIVLQIILIAISINLLVLIPSLVKENSFIIISATIIALIIIDIITLTVLLSKKKMVPSIEKDNGQAFENRNNKHSVVKQNSNNMSPPSVNLSKREIMTQLSYDTEVLESTTPYFLITENGTADKIFINKDIFKLGRIGEMCDYVVPGKAVGKVHAQVEKVDLDYYIKDLESRNGTFINSKKLVPGELSLLKDDDEVVFANVSLKYKAM